MVFYFVSTKNVPSMVPAMFLMLPHATLQSLWVRGQSCSALFVEGHQHWGSGRDDHPGKYVHNQGVEDRAG